MVAEGTAAVGQSIEQLERRFPDLTDIWSLSPLQSGMLFHAQFDETEIDPYMVQLTLELGGRVEAPRLRRAAQALVDRHPSLRAGFVSAPGGRALQVIRSGADIGWAELVRRQPDPRRRVIFGHSMGGAVLMRVAHAQARWFDRIVLSAPMIDLPGRTTALPSRLLLQPLLENAVYHGVEPAADAVVVQHDDGDGQVVTADRLDLHAGEAERRVAFDREHRLAAFDGERR